MVSIRFNNMTFSRKAAQEKIKIILKACAKPRTRQELEILLGVNKRTASSYVRFLRATGQLHVSGWTREGIGMFYPMAQYKAGAGQDAPKPPRLSSHERQVRAWAKLKADPVRYEKHRAERRKTPKVAAAFDWRGKPSVMTRGASL